MVHCWICGQIILIYLSWYTFAPATTSTLKLTSMQVGDLNIPNTLVTLELRVMNLEVILDNLINRNQNIRGLTKEELSEINQANLEKLKQKYPKAGIESN